MHETVNEKEHASLWNMPLFRLSKKFCFQSDWWFTIMKKHMYSILASSHIFCWWLLIINTVYWPLYFVGKCQNGHLYVPTWLLKRPRFCLKKSQKSIKFLCRKKPVFHGRFYVSRLWGKVVWVQHNFFCRVLKLSIICSLLKSKFSLNQTTQWCNAV